MHPVLGGVTPFNNCKGGAKLHLILFNNFFLFYLHIAIRAPLIVNYLANVVNYLAKVVRYLAKIVYYSASFDWLNTLLYFCQLGNPTGAS